ncbi:MAG: hypothetical protein VX028_00935 [Nanoarchaeota archaeon]|nr:hypothetical protein [Nanoarchaeota archaeon]
MIEEHKTKKKEILVKLEKSNEELKNLQEKLKTNSLIKIQVVEKTQFSLFSLKKVKVLQTPTANKTLISYFQSVILALHEEYNSILELAHGLGEFGVHTAKQISSVVQHCFHLHLHLGALEKHNLSHFENEMALEKGSCTLHKAERFIEEFLHDLRIVKEEVIEQQQKEYASVINVT